MLSWVGKRPLTHVIGFPAQVVEKFDQANELAAVIENPKIWEHWPKQYPHAGLLFHGDNKEVLAHLLANGFRGKVDLIYIDPPFDSGADYVRKVSLRGSKKEIEGEGYTLGEQLQYTDIWANDNYLQFMYERLLLLKELLASHGTLYLHCDESKAHHLRVLLDEVFGTDNFLNSICWYFSNKPQFKQVSYFPRDVQTIHVYAKNAGSQFFRHQYIKNVRARKQNVVTWDKELGKRISKRDDAGNVIYRESTERLLGSMWDIPMVNPNGSERTDYPTQKPEALLEKIIFASSKPGDLVLDCFVGSGTTAFVAQKFGLRWIGCDINKGAIQTTVKKLQSLIVEQQKTVTTLSRDGKQGELVAGTTAPKEAESPVQLSFVTYRVNDYDLAIQHNEAVNLACEHIGVERIRTDSYFDGKLGESWVKITPFGHPLSPTDLEELRRELDARRDDVKSITIVCLTQELSAAAWVEDWNKHRKGRDAVNRIRVIELRTDPKYGKFIEHRPARAKVAIKRNKEKIHIEIRDFISPTIVERLQQHAGVLKPKIEDWRAMVDCVMVDTAFNGEVFNVAFTDIPERKLDLVAGSYDLDAQAGATTVVVKIIDMLGEEVLVTQKV